MPNPTAATPRDALTVAEVASRLGISRKTVYRLAAANELPAPVLRVGRRLLVGRTAFDRALAGEPRAIPHVGGGDDAAA